jgi:hypothetical protein
MKKSFGVVHCIADCIDCGWHTESYKNGQAIAAKHAKKYKHKVIVDIGLAGTYDGRQEKPK